MLVENKTFDEMVSKYLAQRSTIRLRIMFLVSSRYSNRDGQNSRELFATRISKPAFN